MGARFRLDWRSFYANDRQSVTPQKDGMKFNVHRAIVGLVVALTAVGLIVAYNVDRTIRNAYAVWWVADMVIIHLESNENRWPTSWDELRDDYEICVSRSGQPWTFEELRNRVEIDFDIVTDKLMESARGKSVPNFPVIYPSDGTEAHWKHQEPNRKLLDYFNEVPRPGPARTGIGGSAVN